MRPVSCWLIKMADAAFCAVKCQDILGGGSTSSFCPVKFKLLQKTKETLRFVVSEISVTVAITVKVKTDRHRTLQCTCTGAMRALSSGNELTPVDAEARSS